MLREHLSAHSSKCLPRMPVMSADTTTKMLGISFNLIVFRGIPSNSELRYQISTAHSCSFLLSVYVADLNSKHYFAALDRRNLIKEPQIRLTSEHSGTDEVHSRLISADFMGEIENISTSVVDY